MKRTKQDKLLNKIYKNQNLPTDQKWKKILRELEEEKLIESSQDTYSLTTFGENVRILGYAIHKKSAELEKELLDYSPRKWKIECTGIIAGFILALMILTLVFINNYEIFLD